MTAQCGNQLSEIRQFLIGENAIWGVNDRIWEHQFHVGEL